MDSTLFFEKSDINSAFKNKSGLYIIEQPLFSTHLGYPIYKIGYARNSLYTRISNYRTAYGPINFKIHALYIVPNGVHSKRVVYASLQERVFRSTLEKLGKNVSGEWFKDIDVILNVLFTIRKKHLEEIPKSKNWLIFTAKRLSFKGNKKINLENEENFDSKFKGTNFGRETRQSVEEN